MVSIPWTAVGRQQHVQRKCIWSLTGGLRQIATATMPGLNDRIFDRRSSDYLLATAATFLLRIFTFLP